MRETNLRQASVLLSQYCWMFVYEWNTAMVDGAIMIQYLSESGFKVSLAS